jgi:2,5-dihydroxypyridine 5,6-dioxygenase
MTGNVGLAAQLTALARAEFELCAVGGDDVMVVYTDPAASTELAAACVAAAQWLGSEVAQVTVPSFRTVDPGTGQQSNRAQLPNFLLELAKRVTFVVDATSRGMLHSTMQQEVLDAGTRMLRVREPAEVLARLFPSPEVRTTVEGSARLLEGGDEIRVMDERGTDLRVRKGQRRIFSQYGYVAEAGRWDHWGTGLVAIAPLEDTANGTLVLKPGDVIFLAATIGRYLPDTTRLTIEDGVIKEIEGGAERWVLEYMLGDANDPASRRISHIGWGCDPRATWDALERYRGLGGGGADVRSRAGGVVVAFGANSDMGGDNVTTAHVDLALADTTISVDGVEVVHDGRLTAALRPDAANEG